jgi:hypothetical protein
MPATGVVIIKFLQKAIGFSIGAAACQERAKRECGPEQNQKYRTKSLSYGSFRHNGFHDEPARHKVHQR